MSDASIDHCPKLELVKLPTDAVTSFDGVPIKRGSIIYFRFAPGPHASEYLVISDRAVRDENGIKIVVVGSRGTVAGMAPQHFVVELSHWKTFVERRNPR